MQTIRRVRVWKWCWSWVKVSRLNKNLLNISDKVIYHISDPLWIVSNRGIHSTKARSTTANTKANYSNLPLDRFTTYPASFD